MMHDAETEPSEKYTCADIESGKKSILANIEPELFANGPCDSAMPVREIIESFDFGQFVDLVIVDDRDDSTKDSSNNNRIDVIVSKISGKLFNSKLAKMLSENTSETKIRYVDVLDGVPIMDLVKGNAKNLLKHIPVKDVHIDDIGDLLAKRKFDHEKNKVKVDLDDQQIADILGGNPVVIPSKDDNTFIRLIPKKINDKTFATSPAIPVHMILDLPSFLNKPFVPSLNGKPYRITLSSDIIDDLMTKGIANITEGENMITLFVGKT